MSDLQPLPDIPKVFCSYCWADKERVREIARHLREAGIDAWFDEWEIRAGDDIIAAMNRGLEKCDVGLIFFSEKTEHGKVVHSEINTLTYMAIAEEKRIIPVLLDPNVLLPALLKLRNLLRYNGISPLIQAIDGFTGKPTLGVRQVSLSTRRFVTRVRMTEQRQITVCAEADGHSAAAERSVRLDFNFQSSWDRFLQSRLPNMRRSATTHVAEREQELHKLGDEVGHLLFHTDIENALTALLKEATATNATVDLIVETDHPQILALPFEAARLSDGRIPALESGVRMSRRLIPGTFGNRAPLPGPLKILVAVGAPDEGKTANSVLDMELEIQSILDATEKARDKGNAYVRILDVGSLDEICSALKEQAYHVLHLSGHGTAGELELEDEDGGPERVTAEAIARAIRDSGQQAPLIFLASCLSGTGDSETVSLAQGLLRHGVPAVLAMQTSVTDQYSTKLSALFYTNISVGKLPTASSALAQARQQLERDRATAASRGESVPAEYATASLFFSEEETPILDRTLELERPVELKVKPSSGSVPMLSAGDLIGRRKELRRVMRVLTDDSRSVEVIGERAGCQILGMGGVGKSSIAGRAMSRLRDDGWMCAILAGRLSLGEVAARLETALRFGGVSQYEKYADMLNANKADEPRLDLIAGLLEHLRILLVLDNFEDNLLPGGTGFLDSSTARVMQMLCQSVRRSKILITSRYPVPDAEDWLETVRPEALSAAQTGKLMLRLGGLRSQEPAAQNLILRTIGGHPRMLEYLDAILQKGKGRRATDVAQRLKDQAKRRGIDLAAGTPTLDDAIRKALQIGAGDILLDELLEMIAEEPGDLDVLRQASIFPRPVSVEGIAACLADGGEVAGTRIVQVRRAGERIMAMSLLTPTEDHGLWVHRWTAELLEERMAVEELRQCQRRAGDWLTSRPRTSEDSLDATRLFLASREFDRAADEAGNLCRYLAKYGQSTDLSAVAGELTAGLPKGHADYFLFLGFEAEALERLGFGEEALAKYRQIMEMLESGAADAPDDGHLLRNLSVSYDRMGDLMGGLGQGEEALAFSRKSLEIAERLVRVEPGRADYQGDLSVSYNKLGDLMRGLGQGEEALAFYRKSLEIRERLVRVEPGRADYQRDLSVAYNKMGDLMGGLGQGEEALGFYRKSLEIRERLAQVEPGRADYQRDLSVSYNRLGDLMGGLGQGEEALAFYRKSLEIRERLAQVEPGRADYQRDLSVSYTKLGDLMGGLGQGEEALAFYRKDLEIAERLARVEPGRADYQRDLSVSYTKLGDLMGGLGQREEALAFYRKSLEILERLAQVEPGRADYQRDLSVSYNKMGDLMGGLGQGEEALAFYRKSLEIAERLVRFEPGRADYQVDLVVSLVRQGDGESVQRALDILRALDGEQRLPPPQRSWITALEDRLRAGDEAG